MFDSLEEQIKADATKASSGKERTLRWVLLVLISLAVFGGLYIGLHYMQGT